jgi:hypothetical protein
MADGSQTKEVALAEPGNGRQVRVVQHPMPLLDTGMFEHMQRVASVMADASLLPKHVRAGKDAREIAANCFLIVEQAVRWGVSPFALGQHAYFVQDKLGFEGKVIAAIVNADSRIKGRLEYVYDGKDGSDERTVIVRGTFVEGDKVAEITGTIGKWKTSNKNWKDNPDQMLAYRGAREWARRHMPDKLLGVYSDDEIEDMALRAKDITPQASEVRSPPAIAPPKGPPPIPPKGPPPIPAAAKPVEEAVTVEEQDPFADPDLYVANMDEAMAIISDQATLDEVWAQHEANADGKLSRALQERAQHVYEKHTKRIKAARLAEEPGLPFGG